jgi:protein MYSM1
MDIHAHLCTTEVMGMVGGYLEPAPVPGARAVLHITCALPCDCVSTGFQCEMDPVSETQARARVAAGGEEVVGWYHSHPRCQPHPSMRDLENQANYQVRECWRLV